MTEQRVPISESYREAWSSERTGRGRPPKYGLDHFEDVARVYRGAFARNRTPTRGVARHFEVTESTAAKWVARCRALGLLPKTTRGRARIVDPPKRRRKR
jgi:hypothetical protein